MRSIIQKLPIDLCNQISAGEVIERPANIIKELVENSIDAGASAISVYLEQGGLQSIVIRDNGTGIGKDDLPFALERYATSKITKFADLYNLTSFGFRGEALASIASISKIQISSSVLLDEGRYAEGNFIRVEYGMFVEAGISSLPLGTEIIIEDLFLNIPVRLKFLSSPVAEQRKCLSIFTKIALANLGIAFTLYAGGREYIHFPQDSTIKERLERIWATEIVEELYPLQATYNDIVLTGYCSTPKSIQKRSDKILLYVNKRPVQDKIILKGIREGYKGYITTKEYPYALLFIDIPPEDIDVNVHPAKTEIRFRDEAMVIKAIIVSIRKLLQSTEYLSPSVGKELENTQENLEKIVPLDEELSSSQEGFLSHTDICNGEIDSNTSGTDRKRETPWSFLEKEVILSRSLEFKNEEGVNTHFRRSSAGLSLNNSISVANEAIRNNVLNNPSMQEEEDSSLFLYDSCMETVLPSDTHNESGKHMVVFSKKENNAQKYTYISTLYENYLLFLSPEKELLIIDQHAAHERVLEHIIERNSKENIQHIMIPMRVNVLPTEWEKVDDVWDSLHEMGFLLEKEENAIQIKGIPSIMLPSYAQMGLRAILLEKKDSIEDVWHRKACTSAVKSGDILSQEDCYVLLAQWLNTPNNVCCPHGRPIAVYLPLEELQKLFKRRI